MLRVEICSVDVAETTGTFDDGRPWTSRKQSAYVILPGKVYPTEFSIKLGQRPAYGVGQYVIDPGSVFVSKGKLQFADKISLLPYKSEEKKAS